MKTAKEITKGIVKDSLRENYDLSIPEIEGQIIDYVKQKVKERDGQWEDRLRAHLRTEEARRIICLVRNSYFTGLPEPKFE